MATCSKRKVSFFIRDILCTESSTHVMSPNHMTPSSHVTSSHDVTSLNDKTDVADDTQTLRRSGDRKRRETKSVCERGSNNDVIINSNTVRNISCHTKNTLSSNSGSNNRTSSNINLSSNSSNVNNNHNKNNSENSNNNRSNTNNNINNSTKSCSNSSNNSNNISSKTSTDSNIISNNNNKSNNNLKDNNITKINHTKFKENNFNNIKATSLQQQQQQQLPVPIPLVPGHHWPLSSDQRPSLIPTSGSGELPVCTWGGVRPPYLYNTTLSGPHSSRGLGHLVPGVAALTAGLQPRPLPCGLSVSAASGGGGYRGVYGGGQGSDHHRCGVCRCGCGNGDMGTSSGLSHPGLQYLGGPVSYPAYTPPTSQSSVPVPIPLPVYLRTRASPNSDGNSRPRKCRRSRTVFSELQLMGLERRFDDQKYLSTPDRGELARTLGLTQVQVKTWYQNRRMKWKKQVLQGGATEPPTKPKGRPRKEQQQVVTMDTTASSTANQHSDRPEVTCEDVIKLSTGEEDDVDCETGSDSDDDDVMNDVCDVGSDVDSDMESDIDVQIT